MRSTRARCESNSMPTARMAVDPSGRRWSARANWQARPTGTLYRTRVSAGRPATDYTARLIPSYAGVAVPLESVRILWQR